MSDNVIYGFNPVHEALRSGKRVNRIYFAKESRARNVDPLVEEARAQAVPFHFVPQAKLNEVTGTQEHQGIAAIVSPVEYLSLDACLAACPPTATLLIADRIQHPKNLGLIIRTALGAGATAVLLSARGGALLDEAVVRASAGAVFHIPVVHCRNLTRSTQVLKEAGFWIYGLDANGSENLFDTQWPERRAIIVGNETKGIRPGLRKECDALLRIPLEGGLGSLNAAVATGVALFQVMAEGHRQVMAEGHRQVMAEGHRQVMAEGQRRVMAEGAGKEIAADGAD